MALRLSDADGSRLSVLVNSVIVADEDPPVVRTAVFDATDRLEYETRTAAARARSAESSEARVRILQDVSSTFGVSVSDEDVARGLRGCRRDAFSATETAVLLRDEDGRPARSSPARTRSPSTVPPIESLRNTPVEIVVHADEAESEYPRAGGGPAAGAAGVAQHHAADERRRAPRHPGVLLRVADANSTSSSSISAGARTAGVPDPRPRPAAASARAPRAA